MQEDIENRTVMLIVNGSKFSTRKLAQAASKLLFYMKNHTHKDVTKHGRQSVKQLLQKDQGATSIELNDPNMKEFDRIARKYGVDYAVRQVQGDNPKFLVFFKARDNDAITGVLTELAEKKMQREERPSVLKLLKKLKELVASRDPVKNKDKELSR